MCPPPPPFDAERAERTSGGVEAESRQPSGDEGSATQELALPPGLSAAYGIQRKADGDSPAAITHQANDLSASLRLAQSDSGTAPDRRVAARVEGVTGADLSGVRVHTGGASSALSSQMKAFAFTIGNDIYFGEGQYRPGTRDGDELLAHELVHTIQQRGTAGGAAAKLEVSQPGDGAEREADRVAAAVVSDGPLPSIRVTPGSLQSKISRRAYAALSGMQQAQVDAVHNSLYFSKLKSFEAQAGQAAFKNAAANTVASGMVGKLAALTKSWAQHHHKNVHKTQRALFKRAANDTLPGAVEGTIANMKAIAGGGNVREALAMLCAPLDNGQLGPMLTDVMNNVQAAPAIASAALQANLQAMALANQKQIQDSARVKATESAWVKQTHHQDFYGSAVDGVNDPLNKAQAALGGARGEEYETLDQDAIGYNKIPATQKTQSTPAKERAAQARLSERELRHAFGNMLFLERRTKNHQLPWEVSNPDAIRVDSAYAEEARQLKVLIAGMGSSRTNYLMQLGKFLGYTTAADQKDIRTAAIGWLVPTKLHTMHEVLLAAADNGLAYNPGQFDAATLAPLTAADFNPAKLPDPDYLLPALKDPIADVLYPGKDNRDPASAVGAAERDAAVLHLPVDLQAEAKSIAANFRPILDDNVLAPLQLRGVPRPLIQTLPWKAIRDLTLLAAGDLLAKEPTFNAVKARQEYAAVQAETGPEKADMIFSILYEAARPGHDARLTWVNRVAKLYDTRTQTAQTNHRLGYSKAALNGVIGEAAQRRKDYGEGDLVTPAYDRGQQLIDPTAQGLKDNEALALKDYSMSASVDPAYSTYGKFTAMGGDPFGEDAHKNHNLVRRLEALDRALDQLPAGKAPVYFGYPGIDSKADAANAMADYSPGTVVSFGRNVSTSRTTRDNHWIAPKSTMFIVESFFSGKDIQMFSANSGEREVLFPLDAMFVVTRAENQFDQNQKVVVHLAEVKGAAPKGALPLAGAKKQAYEDELDGRRLVDADIYAQAQTDIANTGHFKATVEYVDGGGNQQEKYQNVTQAKYAFGRQNFKNWRKAAQRLDQRAKMTVHAMERAHEKASEGFLPEAGLLRGQGMKNDVRGNATNTDVDVGWGGIFQVVDGNTIAQLQAIQFHGKNLMQLDFSQEGTAKDHRTVAEKGRGDRWVLVEYVPHADVMWHVNHWINDFQVGLPNAPDPVAFAAQMQRILVSIHPFMDGNGRLTRLCMDYALRRRGLEAPILRDPGVDQSSTDAEWAQEVRDGVMRAYILQAQHA